MLQRFEGKLAGSTADSHGDKLMFEEAEANIAFFSYYLTKVPLIFLCNGKGLETIEHHPISKQDGSNHKVIGVVCPSLVY